MKRFFQKLAIVLLNAAIIWSLTGAGSASEGLNWTGLDPLNATYRIEGQPIALVDGHHESPAAPGSATKVRTAVWKQPVFGDLDGDGDEDAALLLIHDPGGSGTFYYKEYRPVFMVLAGKRVEPPALGFGADYDSAFLATQFLRVVPVASCTNDP